MEKLRRSSKKKSDIACKKHPKHQQSPGVCSLCLKEKLERVAQKLSTYSVPYLRRTFSASPSTTSSLSSHYSSSSGSSSSPAPGYEQKGSTLTWLLSGEINVLRKSRSLVNYFPRRKRELGSEEKKKSGFWTKLLRPRSKRREEGLVQSRTVREIRVPNRVL
ncbi:hypothetical protein D8674_033672 [Pyrus ussuriensis x Pyrus communis]|uniref:Uncharacterized protein n=1 Tax=Pyrus ussuriensis x Pyrus communis TaxID=2448454 RepID=A0A5N5HPX5_9ROSA|nr:hypothetical protein D8674_033672 [Pyrus ussuriensis x Pyrus communis]